MADENLQPGPFKRDVAYEQSAVDRGFMVEDPVTKLIVAANICVFALMCLSAGPSAFVQPDNRTLVKWGADYGPLVLKGEFWRTFTCMFVHIGALHIALNMYVLWDVGRAVERLYGAGRFIIIYVLAGLGGSLMSLYFHPNIISAGASAAVFGAFGALLVFFKMHAKHFVQSFVKSATLRIVVLLVINFFWGMSRPEIDNSAHFGGFITGALIGFCVLPPSPTVNQWSMRNSILLIIFCLCFSSFAWFDWHALNAFFR